MSLKSYQFACSHWIENTFGTHSMKDHKNRAARVFEEACELLQAEGGDAELARRIVQRCFSRPAGEPRQEAAGVFFTLLAYATSARISLYSVLRSELRRVSELPVEHFRAKQRDKFNEGTDLAQPIPPPDPTTGFTP